MKTLTQDDIQDDGYIEFMEYRDSLPQVFNTDLNVFPSVKTAEVTDEKIILYDLLQKIKYNLFYDIHPNIYSTNKYDHNGNRNIDYDRIKEALPAVCYNAHFLQYKKEENISRINNIMFLDVDSFQTKQEALEYKQKIVQKYDWIIAVYRSLSKIGLHIIINVDKIHNNQDYNKKYDYINNTYFNGMVDKNAKSLTRYTIIPFDYDIYINDTPQVLEIDKEYEEEEKGAHSAYIKEDIICTPYTFSDDLNHTLNVAAKDRNLIFSPILNENLFTDHNQPLYDWEGIDIIEVNLYPYFKTKIKQGHRTFAIGALSTQMIILNGKIASREEILRFTIAANKMICEEPLTYREVLNSFNSNWDNYLEGKLDVSKYLIKRRSFWSPKCTLTGKEKRKISVNLYYEPIRSESRAKIKNAIEDLYGDGLKITQKRVSEVSNLNIRTVKKYWKEFKMMVKEMNENL